MTEPTRIWVDFMKTDDDRRLILSTLGTLNGLERAGIKLQEGMRLHVYSDDADNRGQPDDLLAEGIVHHDPAKDHWVLQIDWDAIRHRSDVTPMA